MPFPPNGYPKNRNTDLEPSEENLPDWLCLPRPMPPDPRQQLAERLIDSLCALQRPLMQALGEVDPSCPNFAQALREAMTRHAAVQWPQVLTPVEGLSPEQALPLAWAVAMFRPLWCALLYHAAHAEAEPAVRARLLPEAERLRRVTLSRWAAEPQNPYLAREPERMLTRLLLGEPDTPAAGMPLTGAPDLGPCTWVDAPLRLRYRLAHQCAQRASLPALIEVAATQPRATPAQRRTELALAIRRATARGRRWRPLSELEFALLSPKAQALVLAMPKLHTPLPITLLGEPLRRTPRLAEHAARLTQERERLRQLLDELMIHVRARRLGKLENLVRAVGDSPLAHALGAKLRTAPWGLEHVLSHESRDPDFGPWQHTTRETLATLERWRGLALPAWWAMTASECAQWFCEQARKANTGEAPSPPVQDLWPLQRTWTHDELRMLVRAGLWRLVPDGDRPWAAMPLPELVQATSMMFQRGRKLLADRLKPMPDARPWLALMAERAQQAGDAARGATVARALREFAETALDEHPSIRWPDGWAGWVATSIGTPEWHAVQRAAVERTRTLADAVRMLEARRPPLDAHAWRMALGDLLNDPARLPRTAVASLQRWLALDPEATPVVIARGPVPLLVDLVRHPSTALPVLEEAIRQHRQASPDTPHGHLCSTAWQQRLRRAVSAEDLVAWVSQPEPLPGPLPWSKRWLELPGDEALRAVALVLAARTSRTRQREVRQFLGAVAHEVALQRIRLEFLSGLLTPLQSAAQNPGPAAWPTSLQEAS